MGWVIKASDEVRLSGDAWVRVWVTSADVESHDKIQAIKTKYTQEVERIKAADLKPSQKVSELGKVRKELMAEAEGIVDEVINDIAREKCSELSNASESNYGIKMDIELKGVDKGSINNWEYILWSEDEKEADLGIDEVTE